MSDTEIIRITDEDLAAVVPLDILTLTGIEWSPDSDKPPSKEAVDIVLLIDTSGSMGADDYSPNRLDAAKQAAKLFTQRKVTQNYNDRVAIIGFGGSAQVVQPLESDLTKVALSIDKLSITHSGTMIGAALQAGQRELKRYNSKRQAMVLLSDGGDDYDSSQPVKVAGGLAPIKVFTIGIGTTKGGMAQLPHGRQRVVLNEELLRQIAKITGGEYLYAPDVPQLQQIYQKLADY